MKPPIFDQVDQFKYRPSIDGLRAIAVLSVIVFHINSNLLIGGFLGVDIFFVISGYLITLLLAKDIAKTGQLNIADFYRRRIQRIFPALLFMLVGTLLVGYLILAPKNFVSLSQSAIWSLFSAANIYFHSSIDTGYFAEGSAELPLLHLWSLGIEEQFYILWPFAVLLLVKSIKSAVTRLMIVSVVLALSLLAAQLSLGYFPSFAYYMLPTRAWELMAGGWVAFAVFSGFNLSKLYAEIFSLVGAIAVVLSLVFISKTSDVPGIGAVPVVLGGALLLLSGEATLVGRLLSLKPMVAIGLVSYSAYLWHWPILAFLRYALITLTPTLMIGVLVATFMLASLSYFVVEYPLRHRRYNQRQVFVGYCAVPVVVVSCLLLITAQLIKIKNPYLYDWKKYESVKADTRAAFAYDFNCQYDMFSVQAFTDKLCVYPKASKPNVLLVGDSHAAHYLGMLRLFAERYGFSIRNASQSGCPLLLDVPKVNWINKKYTQGCDVFRAAVKGEFPKYDTVIIGGTWNSYDRVARRKFRLELKRTITKLASTVKNVIILANVPVISGYNRDCQMRSVRLPHLQCEKRHMREVVTAPINYYLRGLSKTYQNVTFFDIREQLCKEKLCSPYFNGKPVYYNSTHLTLAGSQEIGEKLLKDNDPALAVFEKIGHSD